MRNIITNYNINNNSIYILFLLLILFSCKNKTKAQQDVKESNVTKVISMEDKTTNNFFDVVDKYKISTVPFYYNRELLNEYNKNISSDEDIIKDLIGNRINEYFECIPSVKYNNPLLYSDNLFNLVPKGTPFKINACKILKRFKTSDDINVILITGEIIINQEYKFIVCLTTKKNKISDYKILSKLIIPNEYNQFGISISKDFLIKSVNYSRYEGFPFMVKQTIKINKDASISLIKNISKELKK